MNAIKCRPSQGPQSKSNGSSTDPRSTIPSRNYPVIINDLVEQKPKCSPSVRRIYKLGRKYRNQIRHQEIRTQEYRCDTSHLGLAIGVHEQTSSSPSCAKIPEYRERNCKSLPDAKHLDELRDAGFQLTSSEGKSINFQSQHGNYANSESTECLNSLKFDNQTCKNLPLTTKENFDERNSLSPSNCKHNTSLNEDCRAPSFSNYTGGTDRICRRVPGVRNFRTTTVSHAKPEHGDRRKTRSPSPGIHHSRQGHRSKSPFHRSKSPFRLNCLANDVSPLDIDYSDDLGLEPKSPSHNNKPPISLSSFCNSTFFCSDSQDDKTAHPLNHIQSVIKKESLVESNCKTTYNGGNNESSKITHCDENFVDPKKIPECESKQCNGENSDKHSHDPRIENKVRESRSQHRVIRRMKNPIRSKSCDSSVKNCWTSFREHNGDSSNEMSGQLPPNNMQDYGHYDMSSVLFDYNDGDCQDGTTGIHTGFESCEPSCKTTETQQNCNFSDKTNIGNSYNEHSNFIETNGVNLFGNSDDISRMFCITRKAIDASNDKTEENLEYSGLYDEFQRDRRQSISDKLCSSNQSRSSPTSNEIYEINYEKGNESSKSASELNKLGKKCRSISSAHQERRRWGTPLTLILYVKKKCQNKIRKIMASKTHVAAAKTLDSQPLDNDDIVNLNHVCSEEGRTAKKAHTSDELDNNGNNILDNTVTKQYRTEEVKNISEFEDNKRIEIRNRQLTEEEMVRLESFSRLDPSTLKVIGWSSGASDSMSSTQNIPDSQEDENMCKLSRVEFKRLQEQVRDVSFNLRNRFRTSAYQKLYQQPNPTPLENATQLYRSQLAASLRAFKPKEWPPLNTQELETSYLRCKPINCQNDSNQSQSSRCCSAKPRPKSVPPSSFRNRTQQKRSETPTDVRPGNFDSLNPRVLSHLLNDTITTSSYGEIPANLTKHHRDPSPPKPKDDEVSTSGIDSNPTDDTSSSDDEDDSDYEPEVDENRLAPDLYLRPEKLDSLVLPDSAKGWRKFDFDADNINIPIYTFANPLPEPFEELDLRQIARLKWNWRDQTRHRSREKCVDDILDRLVELERLQIETEDWEQKRSAQINKRISKRAMSAKNPRDKRCCGKCLQPACAGDCPEKYVQSEICELCRQQFCVKTCNDTKYEQRMRQSRIEEKVINPRTPNPKFCKSCQTKHNGKLINANNIVLGRPKSCNSTYSRGQASNKPKDYRPRSETPVSIDLFQEFDKLGIDAQQPVRPATAKNQRPRSRNSSFPSKSFYSQRRDSLTEADKNRFKKKSQKNNKVLVRRPKTAV